MIFTAPIEAWIDRINERKKLKTLLLTISGLFLYQHLYNVYIIICKPDIIYNTPSKLTLGIILDVFFAISSSYLVFLIFLNNKLLSRLTHFLPILLFVYFFLGSIGAYLRFGLFPTVIVSTLGALMFYFPLAALGRKINELW